MSRTQAPHNRNPKKTARAPSRRAHSEYSLACHFRFVSAWRVCLWRNTPRMIERTLKQASKSECPPKCYLLPTWRRLWRNMFLYLALSCTASSRFNDRSHLTPFVRDPPDDLDACCWCNEALISVLRGFPDDHTRCPRGCPEGVLRLPFWRRQGEPFGMWWVICSLLPTSQLGDIKLRMACSREPNTRWCFCTAYTRYIQGSSRRSDFLIDRQYACIVLSQKPRLGLFSLLNFGVLLDPCLLLAANDDIHIIAFSRCRSLSCAWSLCRRHRKSHREQEPLPSDRGLWIQPLTLDRSYMDVSGAKGRAAMMPKSACSKHVICNANTIHYVSCGSFLILPAWRASI